MGARRSWEMSKDFRIRNLHQFSTYFQIPRSHCVRNIDRNREFISGGHRLMKTQGQGSADEADLIGGAAKGWERDECEEEERTRIQ